MKIFWTVTGIFGIGFCIYMLWVNQLDAIMKGCISLLLVVSLISHLRRTWWGQDNEQ